MAQGEEMEVDNKPAEVNGVSNIQDGERQVEIWLYYLFSPYRSDHFQFGYNSSRCTTI